MAEHPKIVVVGSYNRDISVRVDGFPAPGETRFGHWYFTADGGKGSNQAVQAGRSGASVALVAAVGGDDNGRGALALWEQEGVEVSGIAMRTDAPTGVALILVDGTGRNQIVVDPGANLTLAPEDIDRASGLITGADLVVAQLEVPVEAIGRAFEIARSAGVTTLLNTAPAPRVPIDRLLALTDILVANETEAAALIGTSEPIDLRTARRVADLLAPDMLLITVGSEGAYLFGPAGEGIHLKPPTVSRIRDTTGAGDAFIGAFAANWVETRQAASALPWALAAGSLACTASGAIPSFALRDDIKRLAAGIAVPTAAASISG